MELCSMSCDRLGGRGIWGRMDECVYMAESLLCSETVTALLISYIPVRNKSFKNIQTATTEKQGGQASLCVLVGSRCFLVGEMPVCGFCLHFHWARSSVYIFNTIICAPALITSHCHPFGVPVARHTLSLSVEGL